MGKKLKETDDLLLDSYDYVLPENQIAQYPLENRDQSQLLVLDRKKRDYYHTTFDQIGHFLPQNSLLVTNNTKVIPARLIGYKARTKGKVEVFLLQQKASQIWEVLMKPGRRIRSKMQIVFENGDDNQSEARIVGTVVAKTDIGSFIIRFDHDGDFFDCLHRIGKTPLPPYIKRPMSQKDLSRYQCVYAQKEGAVAAPTAGLHFTPSLFGKLEKLGIRKTELTLHVGLGTFQPVKANNLLDHKMHTEFFEISPKTAHSINQAKKSGQKIVAVGTTSVRSLESSAEDGWIQSQKGETDIFIYPGYQFEVVDALITNFHLPKSTLIMLVSAFADRQFVMDAYRQAISSGYRFYSYGDAMLIL